MAAVEDANTNTNPKPRRTNSLAFASTDCHKCASEGIACDRLRPCCSTCVTKGLKCPGFVTPLSWDQRRTFVARPVAGSPPHGDQECSNGASQAPKNKAATETSAQKKFRFVERPATKRRKLTSHPSSQPARIQKVATQAPATDEPTVPSNVPDIPHVTGDDAIYPPQVTSSGQNEPATIANEVDTLPLDAEALQPTAAFHFLPSLTTTEMSTEFDQDLSWDELAEGAYSLGTSDSSQYDIEMGDGFNVPQGAHAAPVSTSGPLGGAMTDLAYECTTGSNNFVSIATSSEPPGLMPGPLHDLPISQYFVDPQNNITFNVLSKEQPYEILLNMYDSELCVLPVTHDIKLNPFRCQRETSRGSRLLYHSIMALSYQHLNYTTSNWPKEANEHRNRAAEELSLALTNTHSGGSTLHLLDSILIMFTLECTLSASGPWAYYLMQAVTVLEASGGVAALRQPRRRSQVGMLLWWDATLALVSRQGLVIDPSYFEYLIEHEQHDEWSFYDLSGCPTPLFKSLVDLAQLAAQQEVAQRMKWLTFDPTPVYAIEKQLREVVLDDGAYNTGRSKHKPMQDNRGSGFCVDIDDEANFDSRAEEEEINRQSDTYHCLEAWRHALLTYTYRVFMLDRTKQNPNPKPTCGNTTQGPPAADERKTPSRLWSQTGRSQSSHTNRPQSSSPHSRFADRHTVRRLLLQSVRDTLTHIRAVRRSSQTQKQLLLPIFWAGSETSDPELRDFSRGYCEWWADKSRYQMFSSVPGLFAEIWDQVDKSAGLGTGAKMPWWGTVIDQKTEGGPTGSSQKSGIQFLFG